MRTSMGGQSRNRPVDYYSLQRELLAIHQQKMQANLRRNKMICLNCTFVAMQLLLLAITISLGAEAQQRLRGSAGLQLGSDREGPIPVMAQGQAAAIASSGGPAITVPEVSLGVNSGIQSTSASSSASKPGFGLTGTTTGVGVSMNNPKATDETTRRPQAGRRKPQKKTGRRPYGDEDEDEEIYAHEGFADVDHDYLEGKSEHQDDDEDGCDEGGTYEYMEYPMRQMRRMFNRAFDQMRHPDDFGDSSMASSSAFSSGDGYSRTSSRVRDHGRTRGIVSETRNGRTKVTRIGDDDDQEDEE